MFFSVTDRLIYVLLSVKIHLCKLAKIIYAVFTVSTPLPCVLTVHKTGMFIKRHVTNCFDIMLLRYFLLFS